MVAYKAHARLAVLTLSLVIAGGQTCSALASIHDTRSLPLGWRVEKWINVLPKDDSAGMAIEP